MRRTPPSVRKSPRLQTTKEAMSTQTSGASVRPSTSKADVGSSLPVSSISAGTSLEQHVPVTVKTALPTETSLQQTIPSLSAGTSLRPSAPKADGLPYLSASSTSVETPLLQHAPVSATAMSVGTSLRPSAPNAAGLSSLSVCSNVGEKLLPQMPPTTTTPSPFAECLPPSAVITATSTITNATGNVSTQLEYLQMQINSLQAQLANAQKALTTNINKNIAPIQFAAQPPSNITQTPTTSTNCEAYNAASVDFAVSQTRTPFSCESYSTANANNIYHSQPISNMISPTAASTVQNNISVPMHRKIYDLPEFDGSAEEWPMFSTAFIQTTAVYQYNNFENCLRLQKALKGNARESVKSLLIHPDNVNAIMEQLRAQYGRPEMLIRCQLQQVKEIQPIGENAMDKLVLFSVKVQNLTAFLQTANGQHHIANPTLMDELVSKIPMSKRMEWALYASSIKPYPTVSDFSSWLKSVADLVRIVQSTNVSRSNNEPKRKIVLHAVDGQRKPQECAMCKAPHKIFDCKKFTSMNVANRWDEVKKLKLCFSCLDSGHSSRNCRRRKQCSADGCLRRHNKLLHDNKTFLGANNPNVSTPVVASNPTIENESVLSCVSANKGVLLFRVVPIVLYGPKSRIETYALLDEGSSVTMMDSDLVKEMGLQSRKDKLNLQWYAGNSSQEMASVVNLHISGVGRQRKYALRNVYGVTNLKLPAQSFNMDLSEHSELPIKSYTGVVPKVLIGLDHCHLGLPDEIVPLKESGPYAANTPLGWVVFGQMERSHASSNLCLMSVKVEENLYDLVANYFETENFGVKVLPVIESKDDIRARAILKNSKRIQGRFQTQLLWRSDDVVMPDSYNMALNRLVGIERKLKNNIEFGLAYRNIIKDYIAKGYVRKLSPEEALVVCPKTWYLPHFGVVNPNKVGKIRLVFDAAATVEGVSLNSQLLKGPQQYRTLPAILFNFRVGAVAVCGDIKEMFHQVLVAPEDRCSQRFLWRDNDILSPDVYEMNVMTFGAACSPCVAHYVKEINAVHYRDKYPRAVKSILERHYVDDFVDSFSTASKAIEVSKQVRDIHKAAGFELRNFSSNSPEVVLALKGVLDMPVNFSNEMAELQSEKVLGMYWQPTDDTFRFNIKFHNVKPDIIEGHIIPTKREILSVVMSVFDPLGFLSNFMITAKLLMREIWRRDLRWDESLPAELKDIWNAWRMELKNVKIVSIPRCYFKMGPPHILELHVFVDASEDAFGAVAYWRSVVADGGIEVSFVAAKTKCAPLKMMSIPRLELQAAVMGTRLLDTILKEHSSKVRRFICWSDSTTVINWIGSENRRYKPFVAHRITEILDSTSPINWRWLPTNLNVADETTRIKSQVNFETNCRWFQGPSFLYNDESEWPESVSFNSVGPYEEELRPKYSLFINTPQIIDYQRFSSFLRLKRTTAWVLRYIKRCQKIKHPNEQYGLTADELKAAEMLLCFQAQRDVFSQELEIIKSDGKLQKGSELFALSPYIDENSILRVYGRIGAASWLPLDSRHPIILPSSHRITTLYVADVHKSMKHQNFEATICEIRRSYWIPRLRRVLRKCISNCNICKLHRSLPSAPLMGSLPEDRLTPYVRPFSYTGLDYFGPVTVSIGRRREKRWVALFTCLTIRAIHLEIAYDLSTDACIVAIRNFINRRGTPTKLRSDNGKNFIGADRIAKQFSEVFDVVRVQDELSNKGIEWSFNCPHNPAAGGAWERMVQCVKRVLRFTLKESSPREHTLHSFLIEAENVVNSRPLTHLPLSHEDEEPLTPNHFLLGAANTVQTPVGAIIDKHTVLRHQWRISRQLRDHFWKRWIQEYLPELTRRSKWCQFSKPIEVGDLVLICDAAVSRREWKRGRVEQVYPGRDGVIRRADVRTSASILRRPVSKLAILDLK